jgi:hypothetical protein
MVMATADMAVDMADTTADIADGMAGTAADPAAVLRAMMPWMAECALVEKSKN